MDIKKLGIAGVLGFFAMALVGGLLLSYSIKIIWVQWHSNIRIFSRSLQTWDQQCLVESFYICNHIHL